MTPPPSPGERRDWSMETHNMALTALNMITNHTKECDKRDDRNEKKYSEIKESMDKIGSDVDALKVKLAYICGGIILLSEAIKLAVELIK